MCLGCETRPLSVQFTYYLAFVVVYEIGWSFGQVSHVALITKITTESKDRVALYAYRQAATVASAVLVFTITDALLTGDKGQITESDTPQFALIAVIVTVIGVTSSIVFQIMIKENCVISSDTDDVEHQESSKPQDTLGDVSDEVSNRNLEVIPSRPSAELETEPEAKSMIDTSDDIPWTTWLKDGLFYRIGLLYIASHVSYNLTLGYIPLFLQYTLKANKVSLTKNWSDLMR